MINDVIQLPGLVDFVSIFEDWLKALSVFWNVLNLPVFELIMQNSVMDTIMLFTNPVLFVLVHNTPVGEMTLLMLILGGSLLFYIVYQFVTWLLNIVT